MGVTFVLRSHYHGPTDKHIVRFADDSVLDWFGARWSLLRGDEDSAHAQAEQILGASVYGFSSLGRAIDEHDLEPPESMEALEALLDEHLYVEGEILCAPHCLQVLTDDDELQLAYYFFDDHFLAQHGERAAYLLHDDWRLPAGTSQPAPFEPAVAGEELAPRGEGEGRTWACLLAYYDGESIDGNTPRVLQGLRLPDLVGWLAQSEPSSDWSYPLELRLLRAQLFQPPADATERELKFLAALKKAPTDEASWAVFSDWLRDHGRPSAPEIVLERALRAASHYPMTDIGGGSWSSRCLGSLDAAHQDAIALRDASGGSQDDAAKRSHIVVTPHMAQLSLFTDEWSPGEPQYHHWIFFDDVWAGAHPALANGVLRWTARWDVLS